jgi:hypothetical protein
MLINLHQNPPTEECSLCHKVGGLLQKCSEPGCNEQFHGLCGYLEGYEVTLENSKECRDDKTKNGFEVAFFCVKHNRSTEVSLSE